MRKMPAIGIAACLAVIATFCFAEVRQNGFVNSLGMKFVYIPAGSFMMGSPPSEMGRNDDEALHEVTLSRGFYMSATEITQGQWLQLMDSNPSAYRDMGPGGPVDQVSWDDCQEFIRRLNQREGAEEYRLPTEAEWEYACRAGSASAFAGGEITGTSCDIFPVLDAMGWYCGNSGHRPHPVAQKRPNKWGLYDMHGNVQEWCLDRCEWRNMWTRRTGVITDTYVEGAVDPLSGEGSLRVFRGGSWNQSPKYARAADRNCFRPSAKRSYLGFRIVKTIGGGP